MFLIGFTTATYANYAYQDPTKIPSVGQIKLLVAQLTPSQAAEVDLIARTVYGEARGERSIVSLEAIAHVILNRAHNKAGKWPTSIKKVILQKNQFSCWNKSDPNYEVIKNVSLNDPDFRKSYLATLRALKGADFTKGANHYHTVNVTPKWATYKGMVRLAQIHKHIFYRA